ncbi:MAG: transcriptional regulator [Gammaproteobacteria bacterium]|nr:transcriptional regulator [Gammaproteobacteria bacterium]
MIRYLLASILLLSTGLEVFAGTAPQKDVREWLEAMKVAIHSLNYEGTFVYLHDNQLELMRIVHVVNQGGEHERLISLNGAAREVVRDNASVTCITPDSKSVSVSRRAVGGGFRAVMSMDLESLAAHYEFRFLNDTRVAGEMVKVVGILPRDEFRYGYGLYLHKENALPLKTDMVNSKGEPISQIMFTSLRVDPDIRGQTENSLDGKEHYGWVNHEPLNPIDGSGQKSWQFTGMPGGFALDVHSSRTPTPGGDTMDHFLVSDGLASVSVYIERSDGEAGLEGGSHMGALNAYGRVIDGYHITVVGAVPAVTVETIASAVTPAAN